MMTSLLAAVIASGAPTQAPATRPATTSAALPADAPPTDAALPPAVDARQPTPGKPIPLEMAFRLGFTSFTSVAGGDRHGGPGFHFPVLYRLSRFFAVGGDVGYYRYGWSFEKEHFRLVDARGASVPLELAYDRAVDLVPMLAAARVQLPLGPLQPYLTGLAGVQIFKTTVDYDRVSGDEDDVIDSRDQVAWSRGFEVGLEVRLARQLYPGHHMDILLGAGFRWLWNGEATYGIPGPLAAGSVTAPTRSYGFAVGITLRADPL